MELVTKMFVPFLRKKNLKTLLEKGIWIKESAL